VRDSQAISRAPIVSMSPLCLENVMRSRGRSFFRRVVAGALVVGVLMGCGERSEAAERRSPDTTGEFLREGVRAASANRWPVAQKAFAAALREDLRNPRLQFLNGLAHWQIARSGGRERVAHSRVGFESATAQAADDFWANLYLGYQQLDDAQYLDAQASFARASRARPDRWEAVYGLGVASYLQGDGLAARLAAEQAVSLDPARLQTQRLRLMAAAANDDADVAALAARYARDFPADRVSPRRALEIVRVAATEIPATLETSLDALANEAPRNQISVDVAIILCSVLDTRNRGINLFDGLRLQFGYGNQFSANRSSGGDWSSSRAITQSIGVPQLDYSLNLFNDHGHYYHVLARPSLTAYLGRESEFFAGRTINVRVSGVNLGSLQPIDVGVGLRVEPQAIEGDRVTFRVNATRSFLSREEAGTFAESLTTFKQLVSATAEVRFGQTLVMSALSETVDDNTYSKTPILGSVPIANAFFKESSKVHRQETLLILVTPVPVSTVSAPSGVTSAALTSLVEAWKTKLNPNSDLASIVKRLTGGAPGHRRPRGNRGDLAWNSVLTDQLAAEAVREQADAMTY
jgi:Flp pilus assembly protein TadD